MNLKIKYQIILVIFILAFISSLLLSQGFACTSACDLTSSKIKTFILDKETNGFLGMIIFLILSILTYIQIKNPKKTIKKIIYAGIIIGSIIAIYFIYLQIFILQGLCQHCMVIDVGLLICLGLILIKWKDNEYLFKTKHL